MPKPARIFSYKHIFIFITILYILYIYIASDRYYKIEDIFIHMCLCIL